MTGAPSGGLLVEGRHTGGVTVRGRNSMDGISEKVGFILVFLPYPDRLGDSVCSKAAIRSSTLSSSRNLPAATMQPRAAVSS